MFFQVPFVPEFTFKVNDFQFLDMMFSSFPNNRPSKDDVEAYKYNYSKKGLKIKCQFDIT